MLQARWLMTELKEADWNPREVNKELLRLPEQDHVDLPNQRASGMPSFVTDKTHKEYDELAFYSNTFVKQSPLKLVPGKEGEVTVNGFFIVGWKDGRIETVDVADARLYPLPGEHHVWVVVFPGMDEYSTRLKQLPGVTGGAVDFD